MRYQRQLHCNFFHLILHVSLWVSGVASLGFNAPHSLFQGQLTAHCPKPCSVLGSDPSNWARIRNIQSLEACPGSFLFDMNVQNTIESNSDLVMRVCSSSGGEANTNKEPSALNSVYTRDIGRQMTVENSCGSTTQTNKVSMRLVSGYNTVSSSDISVPAQSISDYLANGASCGPTILFSLSNNVIVGIYVGSEVTKNSAATLAQTFARHAQKDQISSLEVCNVANSASRTFGIISAEIKDFAAVQKAVKMWTNTECLKGNNQATLQDVTVEFLSPVEGIGSSNATTKSSNTTSISKAIRDAIDLNLKANTCPYTTVISGDSCASLATRCHITAAQLSKYNPSKTLCSSLQVGELICCGAGNLPDLSPKENANGTCYSYSVQPGDYCASIASSHHITQDDLNKFNNMTWAWTGCDSLQPGQYICLSTGTPPLPAPVSNAECGPIVPGTVAPTNGTKIADLNPCPLNACCDSWGFCGTTPEFCTINGTIGCISNCGMDIVNNQTVSDLIIVGYFEGFNGNRSCLNMDVSQIVTTAYSHLHFAFGTITNDFDITIDEVSQEQFSKFIKLWGPKRVLSLGGWAFSTDPSTYMIFRNGVTEKNRQTLANNIAAFIKANNLDGIDIDWEYPGEPDIPGIPAGSKEDGANYLEFLKVLREAVGKDVLISVALPASYWYLKAFPVSGMSDVVDYFIYMTYDLHGQWDYGNPNAQSGCPGGNCLRSHVNITETYNALAMVTKAGASAIKLRLGTPNYGRSFRMTNASCTGPECTYTGGYGQSDAFPGPCTETPGYIADAELADIIADGASDWNYFDSYFDEDSGSNILIYGVNETSTDWVAYLTGGDKTMLKRVQWALDLHIGGTVQWAIDLEEFYPDINANGSDTSLFPNINITCTPDEMPATLQDLVNAQSSLEPPCWNLYAVNILDNTLSDTLQRYDQVNDGYDDTFGYYVKWVKESITPSLEDYMNLATGKGNQYFHCSWSYGDVSNSGPCPPSDDFWMPGLWDGNWSINFTLTNSSGFYDAIMTDLGIEEDWVKFDTYEYRYKCRTDGDGPVGGSGSRSCGWINNYRYNFPMAADDVTVPNPKDILVAAQSNITALQNQILTGIVDMGLGIYDNRSADDVVTSIAMPIFMLQDAVNSMSQAKKIGSDAAEEEKKNLILEILGAVLIAIPFVGEAAGPLFGGAVMISRIAALVSEVGNAALSIESIISDPSSAPFVIFGLLAGEAGYAVGKTDEEVFSEASRARKLLSDSDLAKFSKAFQENDGLVQKITSASACKA